MLKAEMRCSFHRTKILGAVVTIEALGNVCLYLSLHINPIGDWMRTMYPFARSFRLLDALPGEPILRENKKIEQKQNLMQF